jgi:hypothetical protein
LLLIVQARNVNIVGAAQERHSLLLPSRTAIGAAEAPASVTRQQDLLRYQVPCIPAGSSVLRHGRMCRHQISVAGS